MPRAKASSSRRTRSFEGCGTCRRRHVKCDGIKPSCLTCKAIGARCDGFTAELKWMKSLYGGSDDREIVSSEPDVSLATRRHLYTDDDRQRMNDSMALSFQDTSIDASLSELDQKSKLKNGISNEDLVVGPFAVLNFAKAQGPLSTIEETTTEAQQAAVSPVLDTPLTIDSLTGLDDSLQWADLFGFGSNGMFLDNDLFDPMLDLNNNTNMIFPDRDTANGNELNTFMLPLHNDWTGPNVAAAKVSNWEAMDETIVLSEAQQLLKHFRNNVIRRRCSLPTTYKSPWYVTLLPEAINTLAHLSYLDTPVSSAKKSNLFGILAISAYHLSKLPSFDWQSNRDSGYWSEIAGFCTREAKSHLQHSLQHEFNGPAKAKYKDQMSAVFSLLALAVIAGTSEDARCYLIDCERLMRYRGLAKRTISRKCRLLHHMYAWYRIIGESTYVLHEYGEGTTPQSLQFVVGTIPPQNSTQESGAGSRLDDFLRLELRPEDSDLDLSQTKEPELSLRDIHLEDSRTNSATMYDQIFGVSETWLSLVSQTTRLANKMDSVKANGAANDKISRLLQRRAARLEDMICSFAAQFEPICKGEQWAANSAMHNALNSGLVILFYRRIRNVNPWILQSHVDDVIAALDAFDQALSSKTWEGPGTPWPAFLAGCEAETRERRDRLTNWLEKAASMTEFHSYEQARNLLRAVWARREKSQLDLDAEASSEHDPAGSLMTSWVEICREQKTWLMAF
ncbi:Arginine metabolism regulation protein II [Cercospora beticola]|uniref:Arginine metabolism regulation protein II n=2 Tax=Cercospora beticola TaxID=122368 RepID=A0A2G5HYZ1_CERBT|nr:Arginine metabolism regulation protein II [Cercospora beticola]PIA97503.1 Arginine metabolism regulation protein II [Cercospora beticola]